MRGARYPVSAEEEMVRQHAHVAEGTARMRWSPKSVQTPLHILGHNFHWEIFPAYVAIRSVTSESHLGESKAPADVITQ